MSDLRELETLLAANAPDPWHLTAEQTQRLARHLELVLETNQQFNLTSITDPREAVFKHVLDSLFPAEAFRGARSILDLGSGAGYPGIPLAVFFPETQVLLVESTQKKARFLERVVTELELPNVRVSSDRAETLLKSLPVGEIEIVTARAVGSIAKLLPVLAPVIRRFDRLLLYKGQKADDEMRDAGEFASHLRLAGRKLLSYELPDGMGSHCLVEYTPR